MVSSKNTHLQNVRERIKRDGPVAERVRRDYIDSLKSYIEAFYEHGSFADVTGLCEAFEALECRKFSVHDLHRACLLEEILSIFGP